MADNQTFNLDQAIRKVPDFPHRGILYYDITSVLTNPEAMSYCFNRMEEIYRQRPFTAVAGIESRGFLFAAPFALARAIPLILVRKAGKLPGVTLKKSYQLEYGRAEIEIHRTDIEVGADILVIDDLLATGGTVSASVELLREGGAEVKDIFGIIGLPFLGFQNKLPGINVSTLINYESE